MKNIFIILFYCFTSYSQVNENKFSSDTFKKNSISPFK